MATRCKGPYWEDHIQGASLFDLKHLHPISVNHVFPAKPGPAGRPGQPELTVRLDIHYSHHCFTDALDRVGRYLSEEIYEDLNRGEERAFCPERWSLSRGLPRIVATLSQRRCFETRHQNFVTVEVESAKPKFYRVYFQTKQAPGAGVDVFVESAYPTDENPVPGNGHKNATFNAIVAKALKK